MENTTAQLPKESIGASFGETLSSSPLQASGFDQNSIAAAASSGAYQRRASPLMGTLAPVQRMVKDTYPWSGVIVNAWSAALRRQPQKDPANPHVGTIADIPRGTTVSVIARSGNWLQVEIDMNGTCLEGYISQELVDDATAAAMQDMVGDEASWIGSGPGGTNDFATYASGPSTGSVPVMEESTTINCWEVILLAALNQGLIDHAYVSNLYAEVDYRLWPGMLTSGTLTTYDEAAGDVPQRGDLVFFNGVAHVALAASATDIYSFWPEAHPDRNTLVPHDPDGDGTADNVTGDGVPEEQYGEFIVDGVTRQPIPTLDAVERVSIAEMLTRYPSDVTFGPPSW